MITELVTPPATDSLEFIALPTFQLRATVEHFKANLSPADFADLLANVRSAFNKYTAKLLEFQPGADRGSVLHQMMDRELRAVSTLPVSCQKGCGGCCHYEVEITQDEAEILKTVVQDGFLIDLDLLREQAQRERQSPKWNQFWSPKNQCVFLGKEGSCQVYEERPAICRKHLVTTPANACTTAGAAVAPVQVLMAEILLSAAVSLEGATRASLSKMLLAALQADATPSKPSVILRLPASRTLPPARATPMAFAGRPTST